MVPAEVQENGQDEEEDKSSEEASENQDKDPVPIETEAPLPNEQEVKKPLPESPAQAEVRGNSRKYIEIVWFLCVTFYLLTFVSL